MRTKVTLVLIFLNVALFFFIFKFERNWRTEAASLEARRRVLGPEAADIRSIEVTSTAPGGSFALQRQRETWMLMKPLEWPANPHAVNTITQELQLLEHETSFPTRDLGKNNNPTLADYGLDKPKLIVAFTSGDPAATNGPLAPTILRIGDTTKVGNRLYVLSPHGDRIHVVGRSLADSLTQSLDQLRADTLFTIEIFETRSLSIQTLTTDQTRGGATAGIRVRIRRDGPRWTFDAPHTARASRTALESTVNKLNQLKPKNFNPPPPPALPSAAPTLRIALEGNGRHETLFLGEPLGGAREPNALSGEIEYYAQLENRSALFTVAMPVALLETLRAAAEKLREKQILDFEPSAVTAISLAAPADNQPPLALQRLETASGAPDAGHWQIVRRGGENQGLQTMPADRAAVQQLLARLSGLTAQAFVSDSPSSAELESWGFNRPEREITLTIAPPDAPAPAQAQAGARPPSSTPATVTLRLGSDANRSKVYARVGGANDPGSFIYAVDADLDREFPLQPAAWRDRALPALPPNARIIALTLTDLASRAVLLDAAFGGDGEPPAALRTLIAQVRAPRAKTFRADAFSERIAVAGEERPWKYQLDATVLLPGGAATEQATKRTLFFMERAGGAEQVAGSREFNAVFTLEQPFVDALWQLTNGPRDPGPPPSPPVK